LQAHGSAGNPRRCFELAQAAGYKYAGLQHGNECWAGNAVGKYGQTNDKDCNMPCAMDNTRNCGANFRNHVYRVPSKKEEKGTGATMTPLGDDGAGDSGPSFTSSGDDDGGAGATMTPITTDGAKTMMQPVP